MPRPGALANGYSVLAAPPTWLFSSSTRTSSPWRASRTAATSPLCPAPQTMTSTSRDMGAHLTGDRPARRAATGHPVYGLASGMEPTLEQILADYDDAAPL